MLFVVVPPNAIPLFNCTKFVTPEIVLLLGRVIVPDVLTDPVTSSATVGFALLIPTFPFPFNGFKIIFPVLFPPIVKFWFCVVWITPAELKVKLPEVVALPEFAKTWNVAEAVDAPPTAKSRVVLYGERTLLFNCQKFVPKD